MKKGTIKVSVCYPSGEGKTFDMPYYQNIHIPMATELLGSALLGTSIEAGVSGGLPGSPAPFMAVGHLFFNSVEDFTQAFGPVMGKLVADIPNYTNTEALVQISEVIS